MCFRSIFDPKLQIKKNEKTKNNNLISFLIFLSSKAIDILKKQSMCFRGIIFDPKLKIKKNEKKNKNNLISFLIFLSRQLNQKFVCNIMTLGKRNVYWLGWSHGIFNCCGNCVWCCYVFFLPLLAVADLYSVTIEDVKQRRKTWWCVLIGLIIVSLIHLHYENLSHIM